MQRFGTVAVAAAAAVFAPIAASLAVPPIDAQQACSASVATISSDCRSFCTIDQVCQRNSTSSCPLDCIDLTDPTLNQTTATIDVTLIHKIDKLTLPSTITRIDFDSKALALWTFETADGFLSSNSQLKQASFFSVSVISDALVASLPPQLETFVLRSSGIKTVPANLTRFTSLKMLDLSYNSIAEVDASYTSELLTNLDLTGNSITSFTPVFPNVASLSLGNNNLKAIPPVIFKYTKLDTLNMGDSNLLVNATLTSSQADFLNKLTVFNINHHSLSTDCSTSEQANVKNYVVCIVETPTPTPTVTPPSLTPTSGSTSTSDSSSSNLLPIITSCVAGVLLVAFVVLFLVWNKRRSASKTGTGNGCTDYTAGIETPISVFSAAVALWNDRHLLAVRVDADDIQDMRKIGSGAFCDVWLVLYRTTRRVASKRLREVTLSHTEQFIDEIKLVATLKHPNIVAFIGAAWTQEADLQALFEFMDGGDLRNYLQDPHVPREWTAQKLQIAIDVAEALVYVHSFSPPLVHRDLKSRNVLLGSSGIGSHDGGDDANNDGCISRDDVLRAKLTDFGVSRFRSDDNTMTSGVGTGKWLAPEVITGDGTYGPAADIYSFGVVLSELDTHKLPYEDVRGANGNPLANIAMLQLVASGELRPSCLPTCPPQILELAELCLSLQPTDRPTALELAYALRSYKKDLCSRRYTIV